MPVPTSPLRLIKNSVEYYHKTRWDEIPQFVRGIYVLYQYNSRTGNYGVVYVGMAGSATAGVRRRVKSHWKNKGNQWSHFSVFQVWDNIREDEVRELEGLFRHIYKHDARANKLNKQRGFKKLNRLCSDTFEDWK